MMCRCCVGLCGLGTPKAWCRHKINQTNKLTHRQEAFRDLKVIIALYAVNSATPCLQRHISFLLQGDIILQSPDLGYAKWNTTPPTSLFLYLSYSKLPVIESCSPGLLDMNGVADTFRLSHSGLEQGIILRLLCLGRVTPIMFVFPSLCFY